MARILTTKSFDEIMQEAESEYLLSGPHDKNYIGRTKSLDPEQMRTKRMEVRRERYKKLGNRILTAVTKEPWAITQEYLEKIVSIASRENAEMAHKFYSEAVDSEASAKPLMEVNEGVATIPLHGPIFRYADLFTEMSGATSLEKLSTELINAANDDTIKSIILDVDSPGGTVSGTADFADLVAMIAAQKPIVAYASDLTCSAAYWIASAASEIVAAPTAMLGSIGVIMTTSKPQVPDGKVQFISSQSPDKRMDPTTEHGKDKMQSLVDDLASIFISTIAENRGVSEDHVIGSFGNGDVMLAAKAVEVGMADRVGSYQQLLGGMIQSTTPSSDGFVTAAANDSDIAAQKVRSKKYGIGIKQENSNITKPSKWSNVPDAEWDDPVNYRYSMPDKSHADNAAARFNDSSNTSDYTAKEKSIVGGRIKRRQKSFGGSSSKMELEDVTVEGEYFQLEKKPDASLEERRVYVHTATINAIKKADGDEGAVIRLTEEGMNLLDAFSIPVNTDSSSAAVDKLANMIVERVSSRGKAESGNPEKAEPDEDDDPEDDGDEPDDTGSSLQSKIDKENEQIKLLEEMRERRKSLEVELEDNTFDPERDRKPLTERQFEKLKTKSNSNVGETLYSRKKKEIS